MKPKKKSDNVVRIKQFQKAKNTQEGLVKRADRLYRIIEKEQRSDYWLNETTGLGVAGVDTTLDTSFRRRARLSVRQIDNLYTQNAIAQRIIDRPAWDATREGWQTHFTNDEEGKQGQAVDIAHEKFGTKFKLQEVITLARLYGTAFAVMLVDDGKEPEQPLVIDSSIRGFFGCQLYDRYQCVKLTHETDPASPRFGLPILYGFTSLTGGGVVIVHWTRVLRFDGMKGTERQQLENQGFGFSILDQIFAQLRRYCSSFQWVESIIKDFNESVFQIANLKQLLASNSTEEIRERFRIIQAAKSILNAVIIGKEETYEKRSSQTSGLDKLIEGFQFELSAATGIPQTFLFGRSPAGQNATGESDIRNYYDQIGSLQERDLKHPIRVLTQVIIQAEKLNLKDDYRIEFEPLWKMSAKELAEINKLNSETDTNYVDSRVLLPSEVANSRFGGNEGDITLNEDLRKQLETEQLEMLQLLAAAQLERE